MRQAKLGASYIVKVCIGKGLTNHPDLSVAVIEDAELKAERYSRSVHRELYRPQGRPYFLKCWYSPVIIILRNREIQSATPLT